MQHLNRRTKFSTKLNSSGKHLFKIKFSVYLTVPWKPQHLRALRKSSSTTKSYSFLSLYVMFLCSSIYRSVDAWYKCLQTCTRWWVAVNAKVKAQAWTWPHCTLAKMIQAVNDVVSTQWNVLHPSLLSVHDVLPSAAEKASSFSCDLKWQPDGVQRGPAELYPQDTSSPHKYSEQETVGDL